MRVIRALIMTVAIARPAAADCLPENKSVVLRGVRISREQMVQDVGAPKERKVRLPILKFSQPICIKDKSGADGLKKFNEAQLVMDGKILESSKALIGQEVEVDGELFYAQSQYHYTEVLISVKGIRRRGANKSEKTMKK